MRYPFLTVPFVVFALLLSYAAQAENWKNIALCSSNNARLTIDVDQDQRTTLQIVLSGKAIHEYLSPLGSLNFRRFFSGVESSNNTFSENSKSGFIMGQSSPVESAFDIKSPSWNFSDYRKLDATHSVGDTMRVELKAEGGGYRFIATRISVRKCSGEIIHVIKNHGSIDYYSCQGDIVDAPDEPAGNWYFSNC